MYEIKRGAYPRGANLVGHLDYQTLQARFLEYEIKPRADLRRADLVGADLIGADLREANLVGVDLGGADLREADLRRADFYGADLIGADLEDILYDSNTRYDKGSSLDIYIKKNK